MPKCLLCKKELEIESDELDVVYSTGIATIHFYYGSRYDQIGTFPPENPLAKILNTDEIRFYICDDCFEKNVDLFEGYKITVTRTEEKVT